MKNVKNCLIFIFGAASAIGAALLFSRVFHRRPGAIEKKAEQIIDDGVTKITASLQEFKDTGFAETVKENIKEALGEAVQAIEKGTEMVEGALKKAKK